eukprot:TRINITY_DN1020_c0_g1_i2.p2 TRINITY_DN1020_c0_g1~~TRINITY_DN1020_c0_g1_i2.p2  ORF type:complete len:136 (+),score=48.64 TRINITY_DN1020_c0_g1_i2:250-657(+)
MLVLDAKEQDAAKKLVKINSTLDPLTKLECLDGSDGKDQQAASGYELTRGSQGEMGRDLFKSAKQFVGICHEFGTYHGLFIGHAISVENQAFNHAPEHQQYWAQYTRDAFYVRTAEWRAAILRRGTDLFDQLLVA